MAALPGIDRACKELGLSGRAATASSTAPVLGWYGMERYGLNEIAPVFGQKVVDELTAHLTGKRGVCILSANWERYIQSDNLVAGMDFETSLQETVRHLRQNGTQVVLLVDVPKFNYDPAKTLPVASLRKEDLAPFDLHPSRYEEYISSQEDLFARLSSDGVTVLRPGEYFRVGSAYSPIRADGTLLYRDAQHLSLSGGLALAPLFVEALENGLGEEVSEEGQKSLSEM